MGELLCKNCRHKAVVYGVPVPFKPDEICLKTNTLIRYKRRYEPLGCIYSDERDRKKLTLERIKRGFM